MSKAILVFDMPMNCYECELNNYHFCDVTGDCIEEYRNTEYRPDFCPLRELPVKQYGSYSGCDMFSDGLDDGWNACIDEILGENL